MFRGTVVLPLLLAAATVTACSGGGGGHPHTGAPSAVHASAATRWWGDANAQAGSTIDAADPTAAAAGLHRDRSSYCTILRQTVAAGHNVLGSGAAPVATTTVQAWLAELEAVAPASVVPAWKTLGSAVITLLDSKGKAGADLLPPGVQKSDVSAASKVVATDAKTGCGLVLTSTQQTK